MKSDIKTHTFRGTKYLIEFLPPSKVSSGTAFGNCQHPEIQRPKIRFANNIRKDAELRVLIHESLHACNFNLSEKEVHEMSRDIAKFLKRLGYIRLKEDEEIVKK